jgi:hypothetical protein
MTAQPQWKEVGHIGDVNWAEYGGGPVSVDETGKYEPELEYVEPPEDFDDPSARWTIYRVVLDPGVPDWGDLEAVANAVGADLDTLKEAFESDDPIDRANAYSDWASHYGWFELDQYPLALTRLEVETRYDVDLGGKSSIVNAIEETVERMADESGAASWSSLGDKILGDLDEAGFDSASAVCIGEFGSDGQAVNGDLLVDRHWEQALGLKPSKHPKLWSEVGTRQLEGWLEQNGYELTDFGGRVPTTEEEVSGEHVVRAVAEQLKLPEEQVEAVAKTIDWWQEEIPWGSSGDTSTWAKRKSSVERRGPWAGRVKPEESRHRTRRR